MSILPISCEGRDPPVPDSGAADGVSSQHQITKRERYREIIAVLARYGFGVVDDRVLGHATAEQARAEHLRLACEELGTVPAQLIAEVIEEDLRASPEEIFSRFDDTPLGSASIGQVHAARLTDGREVVVKVRSPASTRSCASTWRSSRA
jgi:hypothetical protein